jgi:hypothetical protein
MRTRPDNPLSPGKSGGDADEARQPALPPCRVNRRDGERHLSSAAQASDGRRHRVRVVHGFHHDRIRAIDDVDTKTCQGSPSERGGRVPPQGDAAGPRCRGESHGRDGVTQVPPDIVCQRLTARAEPATWLRFGLTARTKECLDNRFLGPRPKALRGQRGGPGLAGHRAVHTVAHEDRGAYATPADTETRESGAALNADKITERSRQRVDVGHTVGHVGDIHDIGVVAEEHVVSRRPGVSDRGRYSCAPVRDAGEH